MLEHVQNKKEIKILILVFFIIGIFGIAVKYFEFYNIKIISAMTTNIYEHPLQVSNASLSIQSDIYKIDRHMEDIILSLSDKEILSLIQEIHAHELSIYKNFAIIEDNIIDNNSLKLEIEIRKLFAEWKPIRNETLLLVKNDRKDNLIAISRDKESKHILKLEDSTLKLYAYAHDKAISFKNKSDSSFEILKIINILISLTFLSLFILLGYYIIHRISNYIFKNEHLNNVLSVIRNVNQLIVREKDPQVLLQESCNILTLANVYSNAWIITYDKDMNIEYIAGTDTTTKFMVLKEKLEQGWIPHCMDQTINSNNPYSFVENMKKDCYECPLHNEYENKSAFNITLKYNKRVYGYLTLVINTKYMNDKEELVLLDEVTNDIAYALYNIEMDQKLIDSEKRYHELFRSSGAIELLIDHENGLIIDSNQSALDFYGYSHKELLSMNITDINILNKNEIIKEMSLAKEKQRNEFIFKHKLKNGEIRDVKVYSGLFKIENDKTVLHSVIYDITKQLEIEEKLIKQEKRYRYVIEATNVGLWDWDLVTNAMYYSPRWKSMLGYSDDELENTLDTWTELIHPKDKEQALLDIKLSHENKTKHYNNIHRLKHKDGHWVWIETRGQTIFNTNNKPIRMMGTHIDISDKREAENKMIHLKELYDNIIDSVDNLIFAKDINFIYIKCNKAFEKFVGKSKDQIIGKTDYEIFDKKVSKYFCENDKYILSFNKPKSNYEWITYPNGEKFYLLTVKSPLIDTQGNLYGLVGNSVDITKEENLHKLLQDAQSLAKLGSWEYNIVQDKLKCSNEIYKFYGFTDFSMELQKDSLYNFFHPEDVQIAEQAFLDSMNSKELTISQNRIIRQDNGSIRYLEHRWKTEYDNDIAIRTVGTSQDITEQKEAEILLSKNENILNLIIDNSPVGICTVDLLGNFVSTNPSYEKMLGYSKEELSKLSFFDITHPDYRPENRELFQKMFSVKPSGFILEKVYIRKDGKEINVSVHATGVSDENGNIQFGTAFVKDITEEKYSLQLLQQKKKELETIFNEAPMPMAIHNEDGTMIMINKVWKELTGYSHSEMNTTSKWSEKVSSIESSPIMASSIKKHITSLYKITERVDEGEFEIKTKSGKKIIWTFSSAPLGIIDGKRVLISSATDITELKKKDELMIIQSRHAAMGEMIGMIAHQWRQPLTTISMNANNMLLDIALDELDSSQAQKYSDAILLQTENLSKTIDDFRNFFKPDKAILQVKLSDILIETYSIVKDSLKNHNIRLRTSSSSESTVDVYPRELMQVFVNIITNAKDALLQKKSKNAYIEIKVFEDKEYVITQICDNGIGIDEAILTKIFNPYFTTKDEKTGTGLGLYMSKMIIEDHLHGKIEAYNYKEGACFKVKLHKSRKV